MEKLIQELRNGNATVVDVRSSFEFMGGHVVGSINIPIDEVEDRIDELRKMKNLILCCASGNRSGMVADYLNSIDIPCHNAGSWLDVNYLQHSK